jgi:Cys-tRNA(Pro)/Cys-tRNA(Cys) deacylase
MTPAVLAVQRARIAFRLHEFRHDPAVTSYGEEAARALGVSAERVFKTLLVVTPADQLAVAVVPVSGQLDLKSMARALGVKKVDMALPQRAERATGYVVGGISPLGQKRRLRTVVDDLAQRFSTVFVSGGRRGLEIELAPADLIALTGAAVVPLRAER